MLGVVQARLGSTRLPGKVLMEIKGKPLLRYVTERVALACDQVLVLCPAKDFREIWKACSSADVEIKGIPGNENDVFGRFKIGVGLDNRFFVRICADSPLIDHKLIRYLGTYANQNIVTNAVKRTWPSGQCVEILWAPELGSPNHEKMSDHEKEHVMPWFYTNRDFLNVHNPLGDFSAVNMCVDTQEDFDRISDVIGRMTRPHVDYGWHEIMGMLA